MDNSRTARSLSSWTSYSRYFTMILNGCTMPSGRDFMSSSSPCLPAKAIFSSISSQGSHQEGKPLLHLSAASTQLLSGDQGSLLRTIPLLPRRQKSRMTPQASKDVPYSFRFPPMTKKPRWWWRTLACLPYLMPLHETWMYAETAYHLHPFLEDFEFLTYPISWSHWAVAKLVLDGILFVAYLGIVRRKEWPHFFRFHVVMVCCWRLHCSRGIAYLFTVLESIRCALAGMYADIPFVCDAAYIQIPYD
ncbi:hypothetical protein RGQ29_009771 [Quercus rubra]|uniref:Protein TIC 20 n=1 Tax=Quercus rubra TaxID=3512 RepID=A0AAN7G0H1_QUERU|nr:hypothetical protein RGQ29_009771 [Quercus rubra]